MNQRSYELTALIDINLALPAMEWRGCPDHPEKNSNSTCWGIYPKGDRSAERIALVSVGESLVALREALPQLIADAVELNETRWKPLWVGDDGELEMHGDLEEANTYQFAIQLSDETWEYFQDAVIWDSETPPDWGGGDHGWNLEDVKAFRIVLPPELP